MPASCRVAPPHARYAATGGRDYEAWDRILDGIGRCATRLMQYSGDPIHPDWPAAAVQAVTAAAGVTFKDGALAEPTHRALAQALLTTVRRADAYFLISPDDLHQIAAYFSGT
ncbi:hypothetical protein [Streptomyces sp. NPDC006739]|uniref:hypothetical protein n=1 Tax=Streptomyces sp. NPDC006739 TaxID=3364763 RepID=UPI0036C0425D